MWGQVLHSPSWPYAWHVSTQQMLLKPHWGALQRVSDSASVLPSWKSCWITCEPTHPLLWNRRRLTKLADGTQSAPRPPDFPAEVSGPTPRTFITQDSSASSVVSHFPQYNGCCLPARPPLICPYSPLSCLTSNPVLFVCFFVCFPVLWPVVLLFPGENRAPQKEDINQRLMSS